MFRILLSLMVFFTSIHSVVAGTATATGTLLVTATVINACTITGSTLNFGNVGTAQVDAQTNITALCTNGTAYTITMDAGTGSGATVTTRKMTAVGPTTGTLNYSLYTDAARTNNWGNTAATGLTGTGTGLPQLIPVYGRVPAGQTAAPGAYTDTVGITLTFTSST